MRALRWIALPVLLVVASALHAREWRKARAEAKKNAWLQRVRELEQLDGLEG